MNSSILNGPSGNHLLRKPLFVIPLVLVGLLAGSGMGASLTPESLPVRSDDPVLERVNGVMYYSDTRFSGKLKDGLTLTDYKNGLKHGKSVAMYKNGQTNYIRTYSRGLETGTHSGWWENGTPRFVYHFEAGVHHGVSRDWFSDGSLFRDFNYEHGYEEGPQIMYFENGSLRANYVVRDGRRFGLMGTKPCTG
jgi:hypothetical protein